MKNKINFFLIGIIVLAVTVRFWDLGKIPISPDWDEVALGYNAYSISETGKDEYGKFLPIVLRSFDDYKPALYAYLIIPFIKIFGLNVFAVRVPSALFGVLTVLSTYYLVKTIFGSRKSLALLSAFLLAISPWHIQFSRIAFEANVGLALNVFSILFFLYGLKRPRFLLLSLALMGFNIYVYQSEKVLTPLLLFVLTVIFLKQLLKIKKIFTISLLLFFFISLPFVIFTLTNKDAFARAKGVSIFYDKSIFPANDSLKLVRDQMSNDQIGRLLDSHAVFYLKKIVSNYLSHFDFNWLFIKGDLNNNRHHAPNMALLYLFDLPFLLIGIYMFLFSEIDKKYKFLLSLIILMTPIPASITKDVPHAVRTLHFLPIIQIFMAMGLIGALKSISSIRTNFLKIKAKYLIFLFIGLFFMLNFIYYLDQYFVQQNYYYAKDWQYGYKELIDYLRPRYENYNKVIVSNKAPFDQSYMFFLFYLKYNPEKYLREGGTKSGEIEGKGNRFENFEFRPFNYYEEKENNVLLIGSPSDFQEIFKTITTVNYPDKNLAIRVVEKD